MRKENLVILIPKGGNGTINAQFPSSDVAEIARYKKLGWVEVNSDSLPVSFRASIRASSIRAQESHSKFIPDRDALESLEQETTPGVMRRVDFDTWDDASAKMDFFKAGGSLIDG